MSLFLNLLDGSQVEPSWEKRQLIQMRMNLGEETWGLGSRAWDPRFGKGTSECRQF